MLYIDKITGDASQKMILTGITGIKITLTLRFMPRVKRWIMGVEYGDVSIQGVAVVCSLNLFRQFQNNIPFGITCVRPDGLDPYAIDDFKNQLANLYLLDSSDVEQIEQDWFR